MTAHYVKGLHDPTAGSCKVFCSFSWGHKHIMAAGDQGCPGCSASLTSYTITFTPYGGAGVCWEVVAGEEGKQCESMAGFTGVKAEFHNPYVRPLVCYTGQ